MRECFIIEQVYDVDVQVEHELFPDELVVALGDVAAELNQALLLEGS